jgi:hypothetical protein
MQTNNPIDEKTKERILEAFPDLTDDEQELVHQLGVVPKARLQEVLEKILNLTEEQKVWLSQHPYKPYIINDRSGKLNLSSEERASLRAKFLEETSEDSED